MVHLFLSKGQRSGLQDRGHRGTRTPKPSHILDVVVWVHLKILFKIVLSSFM